MESNRRWLRWRNVHQSLCLWWIWLSPFSVEIINQPSWQRRICYNFEWKMCKLLFKSRVKFHSKDKSICNACWFFLNLRQKKDNGKQLSAFAALALSVYFRSMSLIVPLVSFALFAINFFQRYIASLKIYNDTWWLRMISIQWSSFKCNSIETIRIKTVVQINSSCHQWDELYVLLNLQNRI